MLISQRGNIDGIVFEYFVNDYASYNTNSIQYYPGPLDTGTPAYMTQAQYLQNLKQLANNATNAGIKPIFMLPVPYATMNSGQNALGMNVLVKNDIDTNHSIYYPF